MPLGTWESFARGNGNFAVYDPKILYHRQWVGARPDGIPICGDHPLLIRWSLIRNGIETMITGCYGLYWDSIYRDYYHDPCVHSLLTRGMYFGYLPHPVAVYRLPSGYIEGLDIHTYLSHSD